MFPLKAAIKFEIMESTPLPSSLSLPSLPAYGKSSSDIYELAKHFVRNRADFAPLIMLRYVAWFGGAPSRLLLVG